jgi:hypothetical protein
MEHPASDRRYVELAILLARRAHELKRDGKSAELIPAALALVGHLDEASRPQEQRECALFTLDQVASGPLIDLLIDRLAHDLTGRDTTLTKLLRHLGARGVPFLLTQLRSAPTPQERRPFMTALVAVGYPAVPFLTSALQSDDLEIIPTIITILTQIGSRDPVPILKKLAGHPQEPIWREALKSVARLGGTDAESFLIQLAEEGGGEVKQQAVSLLGTMASSRALDTLLGIILSADPFLKGLELKREALQAIGRIGDRRVTPYLTQLLQQRFLLAGKRREELQHAIIDSLATLGDPTALPTMERFAKRSPRLRSLCRDAAARIERNGESNAS